MNANDRKVTSFDATQFQADLMATHAALSRRRPQSRTAGPSASKDWVNHLAHLDRALAAATRKARENSRAALEGYLKDHPVNPFIGSTSLFRGIGFRREEVAHTQALAWLLNPSSQHDFGLAPLRQLLSALEANAEGDEVALATIRQGLSESISVHAEWPLSSTCRVDVLIQGGDPANPAWKILIEAKIDAKEREDQIADYVAHCKPPEAASADNAVVVFLTPTGHPPESAAHPGDCITLSFLQWARGMLSTLADHVDKPGAPFLRTYLTGVLEDVLEISCKGDVDAIIRKSNPIRIEQLLGES